MTNPVAAAAPVAPSKLATAKDAIGRGFTSLTNAVNNFEDQLGKGINVSLSAPLVGPLRNGEERLTTMQKVGNIVKTAFNGFDKAGAAASKGIFAVTEQLFGRPQVIKNKKIFNLAGRVTNVVAHVAAVAVRATAIALGAIASVVLSILSLIIGLPVAAVAGAVKGIQNKVQASADAKAAAVNDDQMRKMRAFTIGVHTGTHATANREQVLAAIKFVNDLVPVRFNADGSVATDLKIDEQAATQARILLGARLAQLDAAYAASMRGRVSSAVSSAATNIAAFASNHSTALKVAGAVAGAGAGAYMYPGAVATASEAVTSAGAYVLGTATTYGSNMFPGALAAASEAVTSAGAYVLDTGSKLFA